MKSSIQIFKAFQNAFVAALLITSVVMATFIAFEPIVSRSAVEIFEITQTIDAEISFTASTSAVTMSGNINGLTGGYATGSAVAIVQTNNATGYTMTIAFASTTGMIGNTTGDVINPYTPTSGVGGTADYDYVINGSGGASEFAYNVKASTTGDLGTSFLDNGSSCGAGGSFTENKCWLNPSTTAQEIVNRTTAAPTGATSTIKFKVTVPNAPTPSLSSDSYTATATLTATTNP